MTGFSENTLGMKKRRVVFTIGVTYDASIEKLKKIPTLVQKIIEKFDVTEFNRAHFKEFGDFSLNFEIVYYMLTSDYVEYMNAQQEINLAIVKAFQKEKIEMAFPTQTIHLMKG